LGLKLAKPNPEQAVMDFPLRPKKDDVERGRALTKGFIRKAHWQNRLLGVTPQKNPEGLQVRSRRVLGFRRERFHSLGERE